MNHTEFINFIAALRKALPRYAPDMNDRQTLDIWFAELGSMSLEEARDVYRSAIRSLDSFPSIRQVLELAGQAEQSPEDKGREVGERMWAAISRFGYCGRLPEVHAYIGPIGVEVVRMQGGWANVCEIATDDNGAALKAQWRELAAVIARRGSAALDAPPDFNKLPERARLALAKADSTSALDARSDKRR